MVGIAVNGKESDQLVRILLNLMVTLCTFHFLYFHCLNLTCKINHIP